ncbi:GerAB/ArcD/ProY family transporter [Clostridium botulinum]|uniref:GerAB/ArcD/ProY family transporter n=1 Tax=Clostridium botulinum TaxID=1491 RepID=UPI0004DAA5E6|nr:endospore germination permease [Clostridium botulinum]KEI01531.1 spore gernimation protein KB [Clostridium botulinum C/D str. BKT75002]KEI07865.1 spore gernimation protein KB [Clostridium botulinum C/D str. BKT2873]MCD3349527.1 endospore germination permease [Clostridium botulinum D/C]MCD3358482.1 endospore germination permease [Clostridium botulinum D/C]MCD3362979.1 endospore germination permease [Clostridium botulinum D/C]
MYKEKVSIKQFQFLVFTFGLGSYLLFNLGAESKQDAWISSILATILCIPCVIIYGKIMNCYPEKNIFQILELVFGKFLGSVFNVLMVIFPFLLGSYILNDVVDFIRVTALRNTPEYITIIFICFLGMWMLNLGIEVLSAWANFIVRIILAFIFLAWILLAPQMQIVNMQPIFYSSFKSIIKESVTMMAFPINQVVIFLNFCNYVRFNNKKLTYVFTKPIILSGILAVSFIITNIMILGVNDYISSYYAGYESAKRLTLGGEFQRVEIIVSATFTIMQFLQINYCLLGVGKGIEKLFNLNNYRDVLVPVGFLMMNFTYIIFRSSIRALEFARELWIIYCFFMEVVLPMIILLIIFIREKLVSNKNSYSAR